MPQQDRHEGKTMLSRVWISDSVAEQLRKLAFENDHTVVEEIRVAVRSHVNRNRRVLKASSNGTSDEAAPGQGGSARTHAGERNVAAGG